MVKPTLIVPTVETRVLSTTRPSCTKGYLMPIAMHELNLSCRRVITQQKSRVRHLHFALGSVRYILYMQHGFLDNRALYSESQKFHSLIHIKFTFDKIVG
jgi:hypothetical protein